MKEQIQEIINKRDSITLDTALSSAKEILALKPTKDLLCEIIFEQDNEITRLTKIIANLKSQLK